MTAFRNRETLENRCDDSKGLYMRSKASTGNQGISLKFKQKSINGT